MSVFNQLFISNFGSKVVKYIESKSNDRAEITSIQDMFIENIEYIFNNSAIDALIEDAKIKVVQDNAKSLRSEISQKQKALAKMENELMSKRMRRTYVEFIPTQATPQEILDQTDDELLNEASDIYENTVLQQSNSMVQLSDSEIEASDSTNKRSDLSIQPPDSNIVSASSQDVEFSN